MTNLLFDLPSYITEQLQLLQAQLSQHYCIIWQGEFCEDEALTTLIPGYVPKTQLSLFTTLYTHTPYDLIYTLDAKDLVRDKQLRQKYCSFDKYTIAQLKQISTSIGAPITVHIALPDDDFVPPHVREYTDQITTLGYPIVRFTPATPYQHTSHHPTIICSYDLITHSDYIHITGVTQTSHYSLYPLHPNSTHPLTLASCALSPQIDEKSADLTDNLCIISKHIVGSPDDYRTLARDFITTRIHFYEKLVISGHAEPEEVSYCKTLLKNL